MTGKLLSFLFLGILLAISYHLAIDLIYGHFFPGSRFFIAFWYLPFIAIPALLLAALAWIMGFYRQAGWHDLALTLILIAIVGLTVPTSYACGLGCF